MYMHMHMHMYMHMHMHMYMDMYMYVHMCICVCVYVCLCVCIRQVRCTGRQVVAGQGSSCVPPFSRLPGLCALLVLAASPPS